MLKLAMPKFNCTAFSRSLAVQPTQNTYFHKMVLFLKKSYFNVPNKLKCQETVRGSTPFYLCKYLQ